MPISLEEARTLDSFARNASIAGAAKELRKANSAVIYSLASLESKAGVRLFDRTGYRTVLLPSGQRLLLSCRRLLALESEIGNLCAELATGWEAELRIVVEGLVPLDPIFTALKTVTSRSATRIHLNVEFLGAVETSYLDSGADLMISVLAPQRAALSAERLPSIESVLVAHRTHPLVTRKGRARAADLARETLLTVRGSDPRLNLPTSRIEVDSRIQLNDFHSKKSAMLLGMGFGWMPRYLVAAEIERGLLQLVRWSGPSTHRFTPYLYHRGEQRLGPAARLFVEALRPQARRDQPPKKT